MGRENDEEITNFISVELVAINLKPKEGFETAVFTLFKGLNTGLQKKTQGIELDSDYYDGQIKHLLETITENAKKPSADTIIEKFSKSMSGKSLGKETLSSIAAEKRTAISKLLDGLSADKDSINNIASKIFHIVIANDIGKDSDSAIVATNEIILAHAYKEKDTELVEAIKEFAKNPNIAPQSTEKAEVAALTARAKENFPMPAPTSR